MTPELLVMAAGVGSRYGGLKQLDPVGPDGETLMDYSIHDAWRAGIRRVVFVIRRELEAEFRAVLGARYQQRMDVAYAFQELDDLPEGFSVAAGRVKPWGTGHAVLAASGTLRAPFIVINADDLYGPDGFRSLVQFLSAAGPREPETYATVVYRLENTLSEHGAVSRGLCTADADGFLHAITEHTEIARTPEGILGRDPSGVVRRFSGRELVSMNLWAFPLTLFPHLDTRFRRFLAESGASTTAELYLPHVISELIHAGLATVRVLATEATWLGMTHRHDRDLVALRLRELMDRGVYPRRLWEEAP